MATSQDVLLFLCLERALYMAKILAHTSGHRQYTSREQVEIYRVHTPHAPSISIIMQLGHMLLNLRGKSCALVESAWSCCICIVQWSQSMGAATMANRSTLFVMLVGWSHHSILSILKPIFFTKFSEFIALSYNLISSLDLQIWYLSPRWQQL